MSTCLMHRQQRRFFIVAIHSRNTPSKMKVFGEAFRP
jgi:hypothetical protein